MKDVFCIGSSTIDSFWNVSFPYTKWNSPTGKALTIPFGEKHASRGVYTTTGGNAVNAAITFSRRGFSTGLVSSVGKDVFADFLFNRLKEEGVSYEMVKQVEGSTGQAIVLLQDGERSIITHHGALDSFSLDADMKEKLLARWWYVSLPGHSYKTFDTLLSFAREKGIRVALNPSSIHIEEGAEDLWKHLPFIDVLFVNESEAAAITGIPFTDSEKVFSVLDEQVAGIVVVTRGKKGVIVSDGSFRYEAGSFPEKELVDRTGAGDGFGSGFISTLLTHDKINSEIIREALRSGSANATAIVEKQGASEGALSKDDFSSSRWSDFPVQVTPII